jgi:hypothetical protein
MRKPSGVAPGRLFSVSSRASLEGIVGPRSGLPPLVRAS